ncbi:MAG: outer membrane immunogenic protein [Candidatus Tokpelaia sp. JSC085]|nr:MAG: outer membrane immunogenic protein [Candidatus Tokpelaia sp. JSC085]
MKIRYLVTASVFALAAVTGAQAADIVRPDVNTDVNTDAVPSLFDWNGLYIGGELLSSWSHSRIDINDGRNNKNNEYRIKPVGPAGGFYVGYNFDINSVAILGVDTDFISTDVKAVHVWYDAAAPLKSMQLRQKWAGSTRLRVGYAVDRWMPYVASGVYYGKIEINKEDYNYSKTHVGWTAGTGFDYAVADNILLRAEYRYSDLGKKDVTAANAVVKFNTNDFRMGIAYKF